MEASGTALMGIGFSSGTENRAREAAERALRSPLIDTEIVGASGILLSIAGGDDLTLLEVNEAAEVIRQTANDDTHIIFGATIDERLTGQVWVTVIATGLGDAGPAQRAALAEPRQRPHGARRRARAAYVPAELAPDRHDCARAYAPAPERATVHLERAAVARPSGRRPCTGRRVTVPCRGCGGSFRPCPECDRERDGSVLHPELLADVSAEEEGHSGFRRERTSAAETGVQLVRCPG